MALVRVGKKAAKIAAVEEAIRLAAPYIKELAKDQYYNYKGKQLANKGKQKQIDQIFKQEKDMPRKSKKIKSSRKGKSKPYRSRKRRWRFRGRFKGRAINVKEDREGYSRTYKKQKVTKQQQRKINRRFKGQYSPFKDVFEAGFQETIPQATGKCKWTWRCYNNLEYLSRSFRNWPLFNSVPGSQSINNSLITSSYANSQSQAVYFNKFKMTYEIFNPTNYDMNLVIYDLVCKQDTVNSVANANWNVYETTAANAGHSDPIALIEQGLSSQYGYYPGETLQDGAHPIVTDPTQKTIYDITLKPTESYPFNIYWTIVKKHTFKLQPGATLTHKFIHKPKALLTRGYWGYRYSENSAPNDSSKNKGIKDISSGCLFKYWGQVAGTGDTTGSGPDGTGNYDLSQTHTDVTTLSGRLMFKEYIDNRWYCMDPKYTYTWKTNVTSYKPRDEEELEVINDTTIKKADDADMLITDDEVN